MSTCNSYDTHAMTTADPSPGAFAIRLPFRRLRQVMMHSLCHAASRPATRPRPWGLGPSRSPCPSGRGWVALLVTTSAFLLNISTAAARIETAVPAAGSLQRLTYLPRSAGPVDIDGPYGFAPTHPPRSCTSTERGWCQTYALPQVCGEGSEDGVNGHAYCEGGVGAGFRCHVFCATAAQ